MGYSHSKEIREEWLDENENQWVMIYTNKNGVIKYELQKSIPEELAHKTIPEELTNKLSNDVSKILPIISKNESDFVNELNKLNINFVFLKRKTVKTYKGYDIRIRF